MAIRWAYAKKKACELIKINTITKAPIPVESIAKNLNIQIRYQPLDSELSGMILLHENKTAIIGINSNHSETRRRFSIAHELGHFLLHSIDDKLHVDQSYLSVVGFRDEQSSLGIDEREIEANQFAAELLMPEFMILKDIEKNKNGKDPELLIEHLASLYEVSIQAMTIRLTKLGVIN